MTPKGKKRKRGIPQADTAAAPWKQGKNRGRLVMTIVCEGKTERGYLERINSGAGQESNFVIQLAPRSQPDGGFKPSAAVKQAIDAKRRLYGRGKGQAWVVFDRDENYDIQQAMKMARGHGVNVAYSTPSFDLWLWLHFARGLPSQVSNENKQLVDKLNSVSKFEHYGKRSGGKSSDSRPKVLNEAQLNELWNKCENAVSLARGLVSRCSSGRCEASAEPGRSGHDPSCDPLKRDTQTDVYLILELLGIVDPATRPATRNP